MFISKDKNSVIVKKKKQYVENNWSATGWGPSICTLADKTRFYSPMYDELENNFNRTNELDAIISYQNEYTIEDMTYDMHYTSDYTYNNYVVETYTQFSTQKFKWDWLKDNCHILNLDVNHTYLPDFENVNVLSGNVYCHFGHVYESRSNPYVISSRSVPYVTFSTGGYESYNVRYTNNEYFPANLGCAILFSATRIPENEFVVGIKGGTGGTMYNFNGKVYRSDDTKHIRSLGNNLYLFYDTIVDNINFRSSLIFKTTNKLQFIPPVFADGLYYDLYSEGNLVKTCQSRGSFENFGYVSIRTFLQFGRPNLDSCIRLQPTGAYVSTRYNPGSVTSYVQNGEYRTFHSNVAYSAHSQFGYAGFDVYNAERILSWGDVKYIEEMNATCDSTTITSIPSQWGDWENLKSTDYMFGAANNLAAIPDSWGGLNNVSSTTAMFLRCFTLTAIPNSWEGLDSLKRADQMFLQCSGIPRIPNSWAGLENVSSVSAMFQECFALTSIPQSWQGLTNVKNAEKMFFHCSALTSINLSDMLTKMPNLENIAQMFEGTKINDVSGVSAFIDACMANNKLKKVSAHSACFYNTPVADHFDVVDYPDWFKEDPI